MEKLINQIEELVNSSEYSKATDLVKKEFGIDLKVLGVEFKSHSFDKDGQKRNVFKMQLSKGKEKYIFDFGQSTSKSCKESNEWDNLKDTDLIEVYSGVSIQNYSVHGSIKFKVTKSEIENIDSDKVLELADQLKKEFNDSVEQYNKKQKSKWDHRNKMMSSPTNYIKNAIESKIRELKNNRSMSNTPLDTIEEPTLYDILTCLQKYDVGTFEDFCGEFGYEEDSRTAEKTYKAVVKESKAMQRLFSNEELEVLSYIQ